MHEGQVHNGLRDLFDIHVLINSYCHEPCFWEKLTEYTLEHDLAYPVSLGLRLVQQQIGTRIPSSIYKNLSKLPPPSEQKTLLEKLYDLALSRNADLHESWASHLAKTVLYIRAHWLRMPAPLLIKHLARKCIHRPT